MNTYPPTRAIFKPAKDIVSIVTLAHALEMSHFQYMPTSELPLQFSGERLCAIR